MLTVSTHNTGDIITAAKGNNWEIQAYDAIVDGWADESARTWTYASTVSFTVSGDQSTRYRKGQKIRLVQTSTKYFYNVGTSYSTATGNTTVTIAENTDYTLSTAAITAPAISSIENPMGFPSWFNWTPVYTGFSVDPTNTTSRFRISDKNIIINHSEKTDGTSNANTFTISAPISASTAINSLWAVKAGVGVDNSIFDTTIGTAIQSSTPTLFVCNRNGTNSGFSTSGGKRITFQLFYEY